jgi:hypothetical protein
MELENRIKAILQMDKFNNLSLQEKEFVFQSILANCLILSKKNQDRYLNIISNRLEEIVNLKDSNYHKDGYCYGGIVEAMASGPALDSDQTTFPFKYYLKYREYSTPLGQMTKSILHEFGHIVIKKDSFKLPDAEPYLIDMGGLVISKLLKDDYGHMLTEIINEFTTFLSYKAFLAYHAPNEDSKRKMKEYAEKMGLTVDEFNEWLKVLPDDLFTSYTEESLSRDRLEEGTERMFNPLYVKYTPLVRLMMFTFQNPLYSYNDLKQEFEKGNGLSAKINDTPVNDLLYSYYESSFHIQNLYDSLVKEQGAWRKFCLEFDSKMMDSKSDELFIANSVELFTNFYQTRLKSMVASGALTNEQVINKMEEFEQISSKCLEYYDSIKSKSFV